MAIDFSRFNFLRRLDARSRVIFLAMAIVGIVFLVYAGTRYLLGSGTTTGSSYVASAPRGLQSVQGGALTPEYQRAVEQANIQRAQQAQLTGGSAVPTQINIGQQPQMGSNQCVICYTDTANVKTLLDDWVSKGQISPDVASALQQLADKDISPEEYAAELNRLVKEGKLTPEQARQLLEQYQKQHQNKLLQASAGVMDGLIKSGQLPIDAANILLDAQKRAASSAEYATALQGMMQNGSLTPGIAQQLLSQYAQQRAKEIVAKSIASLRKMTAEGKLTPDVEKNLIDLENRMVPVEVYSATLNRYVSQGKLVPVVANAILDEFKSQKAAMGTTATIDAMLQDAEAAAYGEINDLMRAGKMPPDVGAQLTDMIKKNIPFDAYKAAVDQFVQQNKITPEIGKLKIADYQRVKGLRDLQERLNELQGNNASSGAYGDALKQAVLAGILTPEEAARLMQEYQSLATGAIAQPINVQATTAQFARLQQHAAEAAVQQPAPIETTFEAAQTQAQNESDEERRTRLQALMSAMSTQAQQLITSWQPATMQHKEGTPPAPSTKEGATGTGKEGTASGTSKTPPTSPVLIKAGTILFGVLDTGVNSDYPNTPVMVTIVDGKYKGGRLIGQLVTAKTVTGQLDRVSLNFTLMNIEDWDKSKTVTAYAIDPDTARTVLASKVDYHYLQRFGAIMATSFLQGYANAITTSGSNTTTGIFGTSTTHPQLSPGQKLAVGLGQMGQTVGTATQNYINRPPTVTVDSGVGLGILFMADVT